MTTDDERTAYAMAGMRPEPLLLPPATCAARLPRGFHRLMDDFAREVLRLQPCDIDAFGAAYFAQMVRRRREGSKAGQGEDVQPLEYQPKTSYIKAQFQKGDRVVVPTEDHNLVGTQTTGSEHYFVPPREEDRVEENTTTYEDPSKISIRPSAPLIIVHPDEDILTTTTMPFGAESKLDTSQFGPSDLETAPPTNEPDPDIHLDVDEVLSLKRIIETYHEEMQSLPSVPDPEEAVLETSEILSLKELVDSHQEERSSIPSGPGREGSLNIEEIMSIKRIVKDHRAIDRDSLPAAAPRAKSLDPAAIMSLKRIAASHHVERQSLPPSEAQPVEAPPMEPHPAEELSPTTATEPAPSENLQEPHIGTEETQPSALDPAPVERPLKSPSLTQVLTETPAPPDVPESS